ncbi:hypothetical protein HK101_005182 [Irineochytrium annulatum]|nr:hypothetical protein HK101_005182 [Irineochytrium annulatum]
MYSGSVRDIFTFFNNGLRFMKKLKTISTAKREEMVLLFIRNMCKSLQNYTDFAMEEFVALENENSDIAINFSYESCIKLNNMIGATQQLRFILDDLGVSDRGGRINPNAKRHDLDDEAATFELTIIRATDLQICDIYSSDPYTVIKLQDTVLHQTETIYKNLNPVWNETMDLRLPHELSAKDTFLDLLVYDADQIGEDDLCGVATTQLYLRDSKYNDFLAHDEEYQLRPQGKLFIRVLRQGEIDDIDFWVMKSEQVLEFASERMVHIFTNRIVRYVSAQWSKVVTDFTSTSFFSVKSNPPPTPDKIEEAMKPIFTYLDQTMTLFNESLDRPRLNKFLRKIYPFLRTARRLADDGEDDELRRASSKAEKQKIKEEREKAAEEKEQDGPTLLCLVVWNGVVLKVGEAVGALVTGGTSAGKKDKTKRVLTDAENKQLVVLELVLEFIKAFYYCEIDGRHYGFSLDELEDQDYLGVRALIKSLRETA